MKWREDGNKVWMFPEGILPVFLIVGLILGGMTGVAWSDNSPCLGCHQDESLKKQDAWGKRLSLFVSEAGFKNSVHGKLSCSDCHTRIKDDKHAEGGQKVADERVNCATCHEKADKEYQQGLHSKMIMKGTERAANCYDCHGRHNILPSKNPKSMTNVSNIDKTCNRCHSDVAFVKQHALGAAMPKEAFKKSVHGKTGDITCTKCHRSHNLRSLIDPKSTNFPQCHAAERISKEYKITTIPVNSYYDSFHGLSYRGGDTYSANCASCHGVHDIRSSSDPLAMTYRDNLQKTCGS